MPGRENRMDTSATAETVERFLEFEELSDRALEMVEADPAASPVLVAVVQELSRKAKKAHTPVTDGNPTTMREAIIEVEQAADSAKVAAEADRDAGEKVRQAVLDAHLTVCMLKAKM
jgi:hypothetical protein